jgi:hypothetical protein
VLSISIIAIALVLASYFMFSPTLSRSSSWKATVTPLSSIMGSGFLVSAPLLASIVGNFAVICMMVLLILAYAVGSAIRFNIRHFEPIEHQKGPAQHVAFASRIVLAGAYFISVTYYLQLLAAFILNAFNIDNHIYANIITTSLLLTIGGIGIWRGLTQLEKVETFAVSINLGMIGGLLFSLMVYNLHLLIDGTWQLTHIETVIDWDDLRVVLGLLIVVQGFETSRYLQDTHPAEERINTMRLAQIVSSIIYIAFIGLATVLFEPGLNADVTAITHIMLPVAVVLPILISIAAIGSQFGASVADTSGAGGLVEDIVQHKLPLSTVYIGIMVITIMLTWATNVNEIIAYASRAFALFYFLQCVVACLVAYQLTNITGRTRRLSQFSVVGLSCLAVFVLGIPSGG